MQLQFARTTLLMAGLLTGPAIAAELEDEDKKRKYQQRTQIVSAADSTHSGNGAKPVSVTPTDFEAEALPADWGRNWDLTSY